MAFVAHASAPLVAQAVGSRLQQGGRASRGQRESFLVSGRKRAHCVLGTATFKNGGSAPDPALLFFIGKALYKRFGNFTPDSSGIKTQKCPFTITQLTANPFFSVLKLPKNRRHLHGVPCGWENAGSSAPTANVNATFLFSRDFKNPSCHAQRSK